MLDLRPFARLGRFRNEWLDAHYHFSFANYYDPARMGWGPLLVWNDDTIRPGTGFPTHGHADMEIITYIRSGAITHADSYGHQGRIGTGEIQVMSAGSGIRHSEYNREDTETTLFQIWIAPNAKGLRPRYETRTFPSQDGSGLIPLASGRGAPGAVEIAQDATLHAVQLAAGAELTHDFTGRRGYLVGVSGDLRVGGTSVAARDGLAIIDETSLVFQAGGQGATAVLADLAL